MNVRAHIKRRKTCIWNSGSESRFLHSKCWDLQARTKGSSPFLDRIILAIPVAKVYFNSLETHLSSIQISIITSTVHLIIRIIQKKLQRKDQDPTTMMTIQLQNVEPLKYFKFLSAKQRLCNQRSRALSMFTEKKIRF